MLAAACTPAADACVPHAALPALLSFSQGTAAQPRATCSPAFVALARQANVQSPPLPGLTIAGDGRAATRHLLAWGREQRCPDPEALAADMETLFRGKRLGPARGLLWWRHCQWQRQAARQTCHPPPSLPPHVGAEHSDVRAPGGIDLDRVFKATLRLARKHEVTVDSSFAALVVGARPGCGWRALSCAEAPTGPWCDVGTAAGHEAAWAAAPRRSS